MSFEHENENHISHDVSDEQKTVEDTKPHLVHAMMENDKREESTRRYKNQKDKKCPGAENMRSVASQ
jgi:hypothetical protein